MTRKDYIIIALCILLCGQTEVKGLEGLVIQALWSGGLLIALWRIRRRKNEVY